MVFSEHGVEFADVFVLVADSLRTGHEIVDTMDVLVQAATRFAVATGAGILLADTAGILHVVASSNERTADVEEAQIGFDEGPCLQSFHTGQAVEIPDLTFDTRRWPRFAQMAASRGFRAVEAFPLRLRERNVGAMNLFSPRPGFFSDRDTALALVLAQVATISLVQKRISRNQATVNDQLQRALRSLVLIEQAKGVFAQRHSLSIDAAFTLLRTHVRNNHQRLHQIADRIVNHGLIV